MSRIGKMPVAVPSGVKIEIKGQALKVEGPKGSLTMDVNPDITVNVSDNEVTVSRPSDHRRHRALHGLTRSLVANLVTGVSEGFVKSLEIQGVGYRANMEGKKLVMTLGFSHQVEYPTPEGVTIDVKDQRFVNVTGIDKQVVGQVAAEIRGFKPPEPYKGTGIRYVGEYVRRKEGKTGAK